MKYYQLLILTFIVGIILYFLGAQKWELKVTGAFFVINIILLPLGWWKASELLARYIK